MENINKMKVRGNIINILERTIQYGTITIESGIIQKIDIESTTEKSGSPYILSGFVDAHVHIESSMLTPRTICSFSGGSWNSRNGF